MSANIPTGGQPRQLDRRAEPEEQVTEEQVKDTGRLARLLMTVLRDIALIKRRFWPGRIDHEDRAIDDDTGVSLFRFPHGFGSRVRWWPVDWSGSVGGPQLVRHSSSDTDTLILVSYATGTVTLRIEEAG